MTSRNAQKKSLRESHSLPYALSIAENVAYKESFYCALSELPWLRIEFNEMPPAGHWVKLSYVTSLLDPLVRPLLRCFVGNSYHDEILPGGLFGRSIWIGHIPEDTHEIWISPTNRAGPFAFSIEALEPIPTAKLIYQCFCNNPRRCLTGIGAHLLGLRYAAKTEFHRVLSATALGDYDSWRKQQLRKLDLTHVDIPRTDWRAGPQIRFVTSTSAGDRTDLSSLITQLREQPYPNWTLAVVSSAADDDAFGPNLDGHDKRVLTISPDAAANDLLDGLSDDDVLAPISAGDLIPAYVAAAFAEASLQDPEAEIFYGDEDSIDRDGRYMAPQLRPDWSPVFCSQSFYLGAAIFFRIRIARILYRDVRARECMPSPETIARTVLPHGAAVSHIRRIMRTCKTSSKSQLHLEQDRNVERVLQAGHESANPCVTIIIPTKDRVELLERCVGSLQAKTLNRNIELIIVDNGSIEEGARSFLASLKRNPRCRVLSHPGPFNFAKMCNDAAAMARAGTLVFLNNDTEIIDEHWLDPLLFWAQQPDVGAVGAKLLYPNDRVQHAGVVLGTDGRAAHFERMAAKGDPGYFGRLCVPHEISAVTAACLVVEKQKFDAVGGFDAVNLPVELNDIDLCLRLKERGWTCLCVPDSVLIHHEAASRGRTLRPDKTYQREHDYFRKKWMHRLRDDPYFHPALSLHSLGPALG